MARIFVSFVHEDDQIASAVRDLLQTELDLREEVFLSSDKSQIYARDLWLQKIKEALSAAEIVILMLSKRSVARPWGNFEAGAAWLADKAIIPVCYGIYQWMNFLIHILEFKRSTCHHRRITY